MTTSRSWLRRLGPQRGRLALAFLLGALALLAGLGLLALSGWFISAAAIAGASAATAVLFDIFRPGALIRACAIVRTASRYGERLVSHDAVLHLLADLRLHAYRRLARLVPEPLGRRADGDLLQRVVTDIDTLDERPLRVLLPLAWAVLVGIATLLLIALAAPTLVVVALPWLLAAGVLVPLATARQALRANRILGEQAGQRRQQAIEHLRSLTTLLLCGAWPQRRRDWQVLDRELVDGRLRQRLIDAGGLALVMLCIGSAAWALLLRGDVLVAARSLSVPLLAMATLATLATLEAFGPAAAAMQAWARTRAAETRLDALFALPEAIVFVEARTELVTGATDITLDGVSYFHGLDGNRTEVEGDRAADSGGLPSTMTQLTGLGLAPTRLHIEAGSRVVISGPSGSGKSTLAALLARTLDPQRGRILFGTADLRDLPESTLRSRVATLGQRPHLFAMSLAENLRLADPAADDARLLAALDAVALTDFVRSLPLGLATAIGEYGVGLSGGEAGRVALARTLLQRADLVLLDEPFEGLDDATRDRVVMALDRWVGDASLIVISHHPVCFGTRTRRLRLVAGCIASDSNQID